MGEQMPLLVVPAKVRPARMRAQPGLEGISWVRCSVCNRPVHDAASRARKMGSTCFKRIVNARNAVNEARNTKDLTKQLTLFVEGANPATPPVIPLPVNEYGF